MLPLPAFVLQWSLISWSHTGFQVMQCTVYTFSTVLRKSIAWYKQSNTVFPYNLLCVQCCRRTMYIWGNIQLSCIFSYKLTVYLIASSASLQFVCVHRYIAFVFNCFISMNCMHKGVVELCVVQCCLLKYWNTYPREKKDHLKLIKIMLNVVSILWRNAAYPYKEISIVGRCVKSERAQKSSLLINQILFLLITLLNSRESVQNQICARSKESLLNVHCLGG